MTKPEIPEFRTAYDGAQPYYSALSALDCSADPGLTHQSFKDECDINKIIENLDSSGFLAQRGNRAPQYFDATQVPDFADAMNQIAYATTLFAELPAEVRMRFRNDTQNFVEFFSDPRNTDEAIELGLATPRVLSPDPLPPHGAVGAGGKTLAEGEPPPTGKKTTSTTGGKGGD